MINAIYLISRFKQSGPVNQALNLAMGMDKSVCNMIVVTMSPDPEKNRKEKFDAAGVKYIQLNRKNWDILGCVKDIKKLIKEYNIKVVHSSGVRPDLCNLLLPNSVLKVNTLRSEIANVAERRNKWVKKAIQYVQANSLRKMDVAIACSQALANRIQKETGRKVGVIHNSVNTDYFCPSQDKVALRESLGLPVNNNVYVVLGSLIERKNNDVVLHYFNDICKDGSLLLMIGDGKLREPYQEKYNSQSIKYMGHVEQPLPYLQAADYLISASVSEGLPNTVLEALACGLPVILSEIEPHQEIIKEGDVGCLFDQSSVQSLAEAIQKLNNKDHTSLSANCRETAVHCFDIRETARQYCQLYANQQQ